MFLNLVLEQVSGCSVKATADASNYLCVVYKTFKPNFVFETVAFIVFIGIVAGWSRKLAAFQRKCLNAHWITQKLAAGVK